MSQAKSLERGESLLMVRGYGSHVSCLCSTCGDVPSVALCSVVCAADVMAGCTRTAAQLLSVCVTDRCGWGIYSFFKLCKERNETNM